MNKVPETREANTPYWRGINHLALVTNDMDATVRFYHGTLGARLLATIGAPGFRHYFFEFGPQCTVAFFEYRDSLTEPFGKAAGVPDALGSAAAAPTAKPPPPITSAATVARPARRTRCVVVIPSSPPSHR